MLKSGKDKLLKEETTENKVAKFVRYCPIIDQVVEWDDYDDWDKKVQKIIAKREKNK